MNSSRETKLLKWESKCSSKWLKDIILDMENKHFTVNHITWFIEQWNKWTFDATAKSLQQTKSYTAFQGSTSNVNTNQLYIVLNAQFKF